MPVDCRHLKHLAEQHELPRLLIEHRRISQKYKTYKRFRELVEAELERQG